MKARRKRDDMGDVRTEIKVWMARRRLSQAELAARVGHDQTWVSKRIGRNPTVPLTVDDLADFSDALGVPIAEFFRVEVGGTGANAGTINYRKSA